MRVGIAGLGHIGLRHLALLESIEGAEVVAGADPRPNRPVPAGVVLFSSYEEMLASVDLDVVLLCTPSSLHPEQAALAAAFGCHVIVEKPLATTLAGADLAIDACERAGVHLAVIQQYRFDARLVAIKEALDSGRIGTPIFANAFFYWRRSLEYYRENQAWRGTWEWDGGGALMNQGAHAADLMRWLLGPYAWVNAYASTLVHDIEVEDTICANIRFESGTLGAIQVCTCAHSNFPARVEIHGTEGAALFDGSHARFSRGDSPLIPVRSAPTSAVEPHRAQFETIFAALTAGDTPPVTGRDARESVAAMSAMYESAHHMSGVRLPCASGAPFEAGFHRAAGLQSPGGRR